MLIDNLMTTRYDRPVELRNPKVSVPMLIIRLFLLEPGENQSHPEMGLGLISKYRYSFKEEIKTIEREMYEQIARYLPMLSEVNINLSYDDTVLYIDLEITGLIIKLDFRDNNLRLVDIINK